MQKDTNVHISLYPVFKVLIERLQLMRATPKYCTGNGSRLLLSTSVKKPQIDLLTCWQMPQAESSLLYHWLLLPSGVSTGRQLQQQLVTAASANATVWEQLTIGHFWISASFPVIDNMSGSKLYTLSLCSHVCTN